MPQKTLVLVTVGSPPAGGLRALESPLTQQMGVSPVLSRQGLGRLDYAFNKDRGQYHCNAILRRLVGLVEPGQMVLGVTDVDLFVPDAPFVLGEADREARCAVTSFARLRPGVDERGFQHRLQVEAVHQAGHLLGLSYCEDARCVMFFAQTPQDCDRKHLSLCTLCRNELHKLQR